jgi:drug/metabolite transporter (DMT)-like permease
MKKRGFAALVDDAKKYKSMIITVSFFDTISWVFFATAMVSIPISIATAISESYPAIAALLGIMINREMLKSRQFLGMGIALASSIALALLVR